MALLPPQYLDAVVAIGTGPDNTKLNWIGTGFLFGLLDKKIDEQSGSYVIFLVTNKHVLEDKKRIWLRFNAHTGEEAKDYQISLIARNGKKIWIGHPDGHVDVAALFINANSLEKEERRFTFFASDQNVLTLSGMKELGVTEGDGAYALGYPMGMVGETRQYVICRSGTIARIRDALEGVSPEFLIDAIVFPGNSGGPVILQPEMTAITDTNAIKSAELIGIVQSYVPYQDYAISTQTGRPRVIFEENSGLTSVIPVDHIQATAKLAKKRIKSRVAYAKWRAKSQSGS